MHWGQICGCGGKNKLIGSLKFYHFAIRRELPLIMNVSAFLVKKAKLNVVFKSVSCIYIFLYYAKKLQAKSRHLWLSSSSNLTLGFPD